MLFAQWTLYVRLHSEATPSQSPVLRHSLTAEPVRRYPSLQPNSTTSLKVKLSPVMFPCSGATKAGHLIPDESKMSQMQWLKSAGIKSALQFLNSNLQAGKGWLSIKILRGMNHILGLVNQRHLHLNHLCCPGTLLYKHLVLYKHLLLPCVS